MSAENSLSLAEEISIMNVAEWQSTLLEVLENSTVINLDAAELCRIDTAGMQLLTAFVMQAQSAGIDFKWQNPSQILIGTAKQLGLEQALLLEAGEWE